MRSMILAGGAAVMGAGAYMGGAFEQTEYYEMAPRDVETRLAVMGFGSELSGTANGTSAFRLVLRSRGPSLVRWDLMEGGKRIGEARAKLAPSGTGTRVGVTFAFTEGADLLGMEEDPVINDFARIALTEKVDSTLDGRAFDTGRLQAKFAAKLASDPAAMIAMQKRTQENVGKEMDRIEREMIANAPPSPRVPKNLGEPMSLTQPTLSTKPQMPVKGEKTNAKGGWGN